jgi:hypothetical protein
MEVLFEDLRPLGAALADTEASGPLGAVDRKVSLIEDGLTVAHVANAALFDPFATSDEESGAAYQAALRVRKGLRLHGRFWIGGVNFHSRERTRRDYLPNGK